MLTPIWLSLLLQPAFSAPKDARQAEAIRLVEEMQRLSQRTAWSGVERQFDKLEKLKGVEIPADAYLLGAKSAQATGNIAAARKRAEKAIGYAGKDIATLTAASQFLTEFDILNGPVRIDVPSQMEQIPVLRSAQPVFDPGQRAALEHANQDLTTNRGFSGYLPLGQYQIGSTPFDVLPSEKPIVVVATPGETPEPIAVSNPVEAGPEASMVFLAARGGGWSAETWAASVPLALEALRGVPGVQLVDAFAPDEDWLVVHAESAALKEKGVTADAIGALLTEHWTHQESDDAHSWYLAPPYELAIDALGARTAKDVPLSAVATIEARESGAFPVPADEGNPARYRIEVKYAGDSMADLLVAIGSISELDAFDFRVEERPEN